MKRTKKKTQYRTLYEVKTIQFSVIGCRRGWPKQPFRWTDGVDREISFKCLCLIIVLMFNMNVIMSGEWADQDCISQRHLKSRWSLRSALAYDGFGKCSPGQYTQLSLQEPHKWHITSLNLPSCLGWNSSTLHPSITQRSNQGLSHHTITGKPTRGVKVYLLPSVTTHPSELWVFCSQYLN